MNKAEADKTESSKSRAAANVAVQQHKGESEALFADRRPEAAAQREHAGKADNSPQAGKIAQLLAMANGASVETVQRLGSEEEELLQGKFETVQRQGLEEEELLQGKFETVQRQGLEEEELLQGKFETVQKGGGGETLQSKSAVAQKKDAQTPNNTGLPDTLKSGIENLSGLAMDDVKVHYNSPKPAQLQAHAFAQGTDIHMAPGQEKHLPHEAWHVVQQKQGRVKPTMQMKGKVSVNDDAGLEREADLMGAKAIQRKAVPGLASLARPSGTWTDTGGGVFGFDTPSNADDVVALVNAIRHATADNPMRIKILTGIHGSEPGGGYVGGHLVGTDAIDPALFLAEDREEEGHSGVGGWTNVLNVRDKTRSQIEGWMAASSSVVVLAWCYSANSVAIWDHISADWEDGTKGTGFESW